MSFSPGSVVLPAGQGRTVPVLGSPYTFKATDPDTRAAYAALEVTQVGVPPPLHVHDQAEEALYVLADQITAWIGEEELTADAAPSSSFPGVSRTRSPPPQVTRHRGCSS